MLAEKLQFCYELSNHLGNVHVVVSDKRKGQDTNGDNKADFYFADVQSATDYYPFGKEMPGRQYSPNSYRFSFNGKEDDTEWGNGLQDYGFRIYSKDLGKFLSVDPLFKGYPELTPYQFAANMPIAAIDLDGLEAKLAISGKGQVGDDVILTSYTNSDINAFLARAVYLQTNHGYSIAQISTGNEMLQSLKDATKSEGSISNLVVFSHAGYQGLFLNGGEGFYVYNNKTKAGAKEINDLKQLMNSGAIVFEKDASIVFGACNVNFGGGTFGDFARELTEATGVTTIGATGYVEPEIVNGKETGRLTTDGVFIKIEISYTATANFKLYSLTETFNTKEEANNYINSFTDASDNPISGLQSSNVKVKTTKTDLGTVINPAQH